MYSFHDHNKFLHLDYTDSAHFVKVTRFFFTYLPTADKPKKDAENFHFELGEYHQVINYCSTSVSNFHKTSAEGDN